MGWVKNGTPELDAASNWQVIVAVTIVCTTFMILVLALRIGVRAFIIKATGADDWFLWLAAACAIASCALNITQTQLGLGLPVRLRPQVNLDEYTLHNFVNRPMYVMASTCYKISLCASYMRIMAKSGHRRYRFAVWATIALAIGYGISFLAAILFACNPVEKSWRPRIPGTCFPPAPFYYGTTTTNLLVDVIVLVLPIPLLWRLQMNRRRKFGLILCFALGAFTTVGAVMRLVSVDKVVRLADPDEFVMWSTVEINLGIITGSIPALLPLLKRARHATTAGSTNRGQVTGSYRLRLQNISTNSSRRQATQVTMAEMFNDSDKSSQENILGPAHTDVEHGAMEINKTIDMHVTSFPVRDCPRARNTLEQERVIPFQSRTAAPEECWGSPRT